MARKHRRPAATAHRCLEPLQPRCWACGGPLWMAYHATRTVAMLDGLCPLRLKVRHRVNKACALYHQPYRPEEEGALALPKGECGLDVIAFIGMPRRNSRNRCAGCGPLSGPSKSAQIQRRRPSVATA